MSVERIMRLQGILWLAWLVAIAVGCSGGEGAAGDGGDGAPDGTANDADGYGDGDAEGDGDGDGEGDGRDVELWEWCPDSSEYVGGNWGLAAWADGVALYCVIDAGYTLEERLVNKARLRVVPGRYPLPEEDGDYPLVIPVCVELAGGIGSQHAGDGLLSRTTEVYGSIEMPRWSLRQPMLIAGRLWSVGMDFSVYDPEGTLQEIPITNWLASYEGGREFSAYYQLGHPEAEMPWMAFPCQPANAKRRENGATFDRGEVNTLTDIYSDLPSGGGAPAILQRGWGVLDGVEFDQGNYFKLSHQIAHHNWGGSFLIMFDEPIGEVCGIKLVIPSQDGGGPDLGAWTMDCGLTPVDELTGLTPIP